MIDKYNLAVWRSGPPLSEARLKTSKVAVENEEVCLRRTSVSRTLLRAEVLGTNGFAQVDGLKRFLAPRCTQAH